MQAVWHPLLYLLSQTSRTEFDIKLKKEVSFSLAYGRATLLYFCSISLFAFSFPDSDFFWIYKHAGWLFRKAKLNTKFCLSLSFSHSVFSINQTKPLSSRLWSCPKHHPRNCWQSWTPTYTSPSLGTEPSLTPSLLRFDMALTVGDGAGDKWRVTGAPLGHSAGGCALLPAGCSAATVRRALGELFLPARSLPAEPCWALHRASHVILESACQPSPFSKHFVSHTFLQDVSYSLPLVGGAAPSLQEAVYQTPWGRLEESHEKWIFVAQKWVCPTKAWQ